MTFSSELDRLGARTSLSMKPGQIVFNLPTERLKRRPLGN